jgi:polysaccharide export outer membrane protein
MKTLSLCQVFVFLFTVLVAPLGLGCAPGRSLPLLEAEDYGEYRLDSGDKLRVIVFGQPDLTGSYTVDGAGMISMPLVQDVVARGYTPAELEDAIAAELRKGVVRSPSVSAQIESFRPFFILGEVRNPGQYPYVHGMSVLTAVAIAGGFSYRAQMDYVSIIRTAGEEAVEARAERNSLIRPGDVIHVLERYF